MRVGRGIRRGPPLSDRIAKHVDRRRLLRDRIAADLRPQPHRRPGRRPTPWPIFLPRKASTVERPEADHPACPAVVARLDGPSAGKALQFDGHLDTVHLPFVPFGERRRPDHRQRCVGHEGGPRRRGRGDARRPGRRAPGGRVDPADGPRPPRGPLGIRPAVRPAARRTASSAMPC